MVKNMEKNKNSIINKVKNSSRVSKIMFTCGVIALLISTCTSVIAVTYLYNANEISYSNTSSGLSATNVQQALDQVYSAANDYSKLRKMIYPVGSVYISVTDDTVAKVQDRFGGTWVAFGSGRALVGVNTSDTDFSTVGKEAGSKSQDYTPAGTVSKPSVTGGNISYTPAGTNSGMAVTMNAVSLSHSGGAVQNTTLTAAQSGLRSHSHGLSKNFNFTVGGIGGTGISGIPNGNSGWGDKGKAHWTTISVNAVGAANATSAHNHGFTQPSAHSFTPSAKSYTQPTFKGTAATLTHSHTVSQPTFTGTKASISHLQPYITVYMYKRTA